MTHLMFFPYELNIWTYKSDIAISLSNSDMDGDVTLISRISRNPDYGNWLTRYEHCLQELYDNDAWFVSESHTNKDKYLKEFKSEVEYLCSRLDAIHKACGHLNSELENV
jgi:hypothetical protein